ADRVGRVPDLDTPSVRPPVVVGGSHVDSAHVTDQPPLGVGLEDPVVGRVAPILQRHQVPDLHILDAVDFDGAHRFLSLVVPALRAAVMRCTARSRARSGDRCIFATSPSCTSRVTRPGCTPVCTTTPFTSLRPALWASEPTVSIISPSPGCRRAPRG